MNNKPTDKLMEPGQKQRPVPLPISKKKIEEGTIIFCETSGKVEVLADTRVFMQ